MATTFRCPCGQFFQVPTAQSGVRVRCPRCQKILQIGTAAASVAPPLQPAPPQAAPPPMHAAPPRPPGPRRSRPGGTQQLLVGGIVAAVVGLFTLVGVIFAFRPGETTPLGSAVQAQATARLATPTARSKSTGRTTPTGKKPDPTQQPTPDPTPQPVKAANKDDLTRFVATLNERRVATGLLPVSLAADLTAGCQAHAEYLARHATVPAILSQPHEQEEQKAGSTQAGRDAAKAAFVVLNDPATALNDWFAAVERRPLLLAPELHQIGLGTASSGAQAITVLDVKRGRMALKQQIIVYPVDGQKDIPLAFPGREVPDPVPEAKGMPSGYPITVTFPYGTRIQKAQGVLRDPAGKELAAWFSTPDRPANPEFPRHQGTTLCLIAKNVFEPETTYSVEFQAEVDGKPWQERLKFTTVSQTRPPQDQAQAVLKRINYFRRLADLPPLQLDDTLTRGCQAHALYLARNAERDNVRSGDEDAALPGYSPEGKQIAPRASIGITSFDPVSTVDSWVAMFHYRFPILDPLATRAGIGVTRSARSWHLVLVNEQQGSTFSAPLLFPAPDQTDVPLYYAGGEGPPPIPEKERTAGFPVSVQFPERWRVQDVTAELFKVGDEQPLAGWLSTPQKPVVNPGYQKNSINLIAKAPLQANTRYEARFKARVDGKAWEKKWTFRTQGDDLDSQRALAMQAVSELNLHRALLGYAPVQLQEDLSRGCLAHARYLALNFGHPSLAGLGMHDEQTNLPGYSLEGKNAGKESVIAMGSPPGASIEAWINTFYHRIPLLEPDLASVGVGFAQGSNPRWFVVLITSNDRCKERLVSYPPAGAQNIPTRAEKGGYPITLTVYSAQSVQQVAVKLLDDTGAEVACEVQLPNRFTLQGPEKNTVALVPRGALKPGTNYVLKGTLTGGNRTWTINQNFRTAE